MVAARVYLTIATLAVASFAGLARAADGATAGNSVVIATADTFKDIVAGSAFVKFYAPWHERPSFSRLLFVLPHLAKQRRNSKMPPAGAATARTWRRRGRSSASSSRRRARP